jgi:hypothetical protein
VNKINRLRHEFVTSFPEPMLPGVLYVSISFATVGHLCCCGCHQEVITPLSPTDWKLIFDGQTVSLHLSIGNWLLPCRSHYVISRGAVEWAGTWSTGQVELARRQDESVKRAYYAKRDAAPPEPPEVQTNNISADPTPVDLGMSTSLWLRMQRLWK